MTTSLPELASVLANYLRYTTGDQFIYARVILADAAENQDDRDYIAVGQCIQGAENEIFNIVPNDAGTFELLQMIDYPGSRYEPPSSDAKVVESGANPMIVLAKITNFIVHDRLASAQEGLAYDLNPPEPIP